MDFNPDRTGLMAAGSYSGEAALYDNNSQELLFLLQGQKGGLTQVFLLLHLLAAFTIGLYRVTSSLKETVSQNTLCLSRVE